MKRFINKIRNLKMRMPIIGFYILRILLIVSFFASIGLSIYTIYNVRQYRLEIEQYRTYISELNDRLLNGTNKDNKDNVEVVIQMPEHKYISGAESENINFADAVAILQTQQEQYNNNVNVMFAVLSIVITAVTIVIPIFNYSFLQREHIKKIEYQSNSIQMLFDQMEAQKEKLTIELQNLAEQQSNYESRTNGLIQNLNATLQSIKIDISKIYDNPEYNNQTMKPLEAPCPHEVTNALTETDDSNYELENGDLR